MLPVLLLRVNRRELQLVLSCPCLRQQEFLNIKNKYDSGNSEIKEHFSLDYTSNFYVTICFDHFYLVVYKLSHSYVTNRLLKSCRASKYVRELHLFGRGGGYAASPCFCVSLLFKVITGALNVKLLSNTCCAIYTIKHIWQ